MLGTTPLNSTKPYEHFKQGMFSKHELTDDLEREKKDTSANATKADLLN